MKILIAVAELAKALYRVQGIVERRSTMPALAHVLLEASADGRLVVRATDMEVAVRGQHKAEVTEPGAVAVQARQLYDVVRALPGEVVSLATTEQHGLRVESGSSAFRLVGMAAEAFPALPEEHGGAFFEIPAEQLGQMIQRTLFCVSTDDNRLNLGGVYCEGVDAHTLSLVATDGHRLALDKRTFEAEIVLPQPVVVPRKAFQEFHRILGECDSAATVRVGVSETKAALSVGDVTLQTCLVDGRFPDYKRVIPAESNKLAKLSRTKFAEALRRVSLLAHGKTHGVRLDFAPGELTLTAENPELGEARESLEVTYDGEPVSAGFNARYILDALSHISEQGVTFELTDKLSPAVIRPIEDQSFLAVVMPMRF